MSKEEKKAPEGYHYMPDGELMKDSGHDDEAAAGSKAAPKKDQRKGSAKNSKGSASGSRKVVFSAAVEKSLKEKVETHNEKARDARRATLGMLKAVYRRGAGAFSTSHRPGMNRNQWAMARVNAFLKLLKSGKPANSAYKSDNDLLPANHPRSTKGSNSIIAGAVIVPEEQDLAAALLEIAEKYGKFNEDETGIWAGYTPAEENEVKDIGVKCINCVLYEGPGVCKIIAPVIEDEGKCRFAVIPDGIVDIEILQTNLESSSDLKEVAEEYRFEKELSITLKNGEDYSSPEEAILSYTEFSGLGYEVEQAIRASWLRAIRNGEDPYKRAAVLATMTYDSMDSDLLPVRDN